MKKTLALILTALLLGILVFFFMRKPSTLVQPLSAEQASQRIEHFYAIVGPRIGSHLVEPNVVLTLAGLRGVGNFLMHDLTESEKNTIEKLDEEAQKMGITFIVNIDEKDELVDVVVQNIKGAEYSSKLSQLPFVKPFVATPHITLADWINGINKEARTYFSQKDGSVSEDGLGHLLVGLELGYPDQALLDLYTVIKEGKSPTILVMSNIPFSSFYNNPQPNFSYLAEHEHEESIDRIKKSWGTFLEQFYATPWLKALAKDQHFIEARKSEEKAHDDWFTKKRTPAT